MPSALRIPDSPEHTIATRVQKLRKCTGRNQSEISRVCGFPRPYIGLIESSTRLEIGLSKLVALALTFGVSLDWLVFGDGDEPAAVEVCSAVERARLNPKMVETALANVLGSKHRRIRTRARRARAKASPARPLPAGPSLARTSASPEART